MMTEMENFIQIKKNNVLKIGIKDENGVETGEFLEFDMDDIELPLRINKCDIEHRKNIKTLQNYFTIIDKKEDKKGKYVLSWKEEEKIKCLKKFYEDEMKVLDMFLGEGGTKKLLNGRNPYYSMYEDIEQMLEQIMPLLKKSMININDTIKQKYKDVKIEDLNLE